MRVFRGVSNLPAFKNAVFTTGTFDGVHSGHQELIKRLIHLTEPIDGESIILTFHPHPRLVLNPDDYELKLLNTLDEKINLLEHYGVDNLIIAQFSKAFSEISAEDYVTDFLWKNIKPKKVVMGFNHHFGKGREGNIHLMEEMGQRLNFEVVEIEKQIVENITVSSTKIRNALLAGEVETAGTMLGHPYTMKGIVVKGKSIGKQIGFPTANLLIENPYKLVPGNGVYAVRVDINGERHPGMLNIGLRPTFNGKNRTIEAHIFDFEHDIYGTEVDIEFVAAIRDEIKFDSKEALREQLIKDKEASLAILKQKP